MNFGSWAKLGIFDALAGIYIHIPFCRRACHYCDFHFTTSGASEAMVDSICRELNLRQHYLGTEEIGTLYFGGGTPSLLTGSQVGRIVDTVAANWSVSRDAEITLEANPDDISSALVREWLQAGVNRLSIGVQSFHDRELNYLNRVHTSGQAESGVKLAQDKGIENITIDLMYGLPDATPEDWTSTIRRGLSLGVPHISAYCLTIEPRTVFGHRKNKGELTEIPDHRIELEYLQLCLELAEAGFEHYEVSNFARKNFRSRHNTSYWQGTNYLGAGPSAHSFDTLSRQWNISSNAAYLRAIEEKRIPSEREVLTPSARMHEYLLTRMRTSWGVDKGFLESGFAYLVGREKADKIAHWKSRGWMVEDEHSLKLTDLGMLMSDQVVLELMDFELTEK
jgi:oxygen-independent coproporphyrinogen III oxidase